MHIISILRYYLGYTQMELAVKSGVSCADINDMENKPEYGLIEKYCRVADALHVPIHALAMNDILSVPEAFFGKNRPAEYLPAANSKNALLGRQGEDAVFAQEQARLATVSITLSKLVLPCYKLSAARGGFDILSFKDDGTPMFIEVKTSENEPAGNARLTNHEYNTAKKWTKKGFDYWIYVYSGWGTEKQNLQKCSFKDLLDEDRISPVRYLCDIRPRKDAENGILHFRKQMGISQLEAANLMEIPASCLCKYETGENQCPVTVYQKLSKFYGVTIDDLLKEYPVKNCG